MTAALHLGIVGPLPPPVGGMATQTLQLITLLQSEGVQVSFLQTNRPWHPTFVGKLRGVRALFRLLPYLIRVWKLAAKVDVIHMMANSGWSWQLFAAPVIWAAWIRKTPVIVNYRGGKAKEYLNKSIKRVRPTITKATRIVVPSGYLQKIFADFGLQAEIIPNIIDADRFRPSGKVKPDIVDGKPFKLIITRNLELIYGTETAIEALALVRAKIPGICLVIAGTGPERNRLEALISKLELSGQVELVGPMPRSEIVNLYQSADLMLNPTTVDNMPNSVLEALASGVAVVSTDVGGIPYIVEHEKTALLVPVGDENAMAREIERLYFDEKLRQTLRENGLAAIKPYTWSMVKEKWLDLYSSVKKNRRRDRG